MFRKECRLFPLLCIIFLLAGCDSADGDKGAEVTSEQPPAAGLIRPENWPRQESPLPRDPAVEARVADLLGRMILEEKVGQVIQADIDSVTPQQVREYNLGSVLNGGNSAPDGDVRGTPESWLELADAFWRESSDRSDGGVGIPVIWGTDAVHGHSKIVGATFFPHNIGLGAANDPELMFEVGRVTATEILTTGLDWTFAPTIAVVRDDRWGRTYEGYSEDPEIVASYAPRIVEGLQGRVGSAEFLDGDHMIATAKHFVGDGGTVDGRDTGDNQSTEAQLRDIHAAGYPPAIMAGVQTVMASFNSYHGQRLHGFKPLLTDVLVSRMGFDGFVVGDWNGHRHVEGCSSTSCAAAFNAGLDMFMAPDSWQELYHNTLRQVKSGEISTQRLDEAVSRILRVKVRAGLFDAGLPSQRPHAGAFEKLGSAEHRAVARRAVRQSLVLLKNAAGLLPLLPSSKVLVTGDGANDIGKQCGGWTLSWQGTGNSNDDFPNGQSIFAGIREVVEAGGGEAWLSEDGSYAEKPDVAIVVFGEDPYAETQGDRPNLDFAPNGGLRQLQAFQRAGIPVVSIFITGRPLWVNPELNASDAFVVAWLPGTEGGGLADVLFGDENGNARFDFRGRLSFSWPRTAIQTPVNRDDAAADPLFPYGYGLSFADEGSLAQLPEESGLVEEESGVTDRFLVAGDAARGWRLWLGDEGKATEVVGPSGRSPAGNLQLKAHDFKAQEDSSQLTWSGPAAVAISGEMLDLSERRKDNLALELALSVLAIEADRVDLAMGNSHSNNDSAFGSINIADSLIHIAKQGSAWHRLRIPLACFEAAGTVLEGVNEPMRISTDGHLQLILSSARLVPGSAEPGCQPQLLPLD